MLRKIIGVFLLLAFFVSPSYAEPLDLVTQLPGYGKVPQTQYAGYAAHLFYWYVAARRAPQKAPIVLWTSGGPGASSLYGLFLENGPYRVASNGRLHQRAYAWSRFANYLVFDQPMGVGLSFAKQSAYPKSPQQGTIQFYQALQKFYAKHPQLRKRGLYLSGESYAGTYIALLAQKILRENKQHPATAIHLKGVIVVSGWVDPLLQQSMDADYAYYHGFISTEQKQQVDRLYQACQETAERYGDASTAANSACSKVGSTLSKMTAISNLHDVGVPTQVNQKAMMAYLNQASVRKALHVTSKQPYHVMTNIWDNYAAYEQVSYRHVYENLLKQGVKVLVFSGLNDGSDCNCLGTQKWLMQLNWPGKKAFLSQAPSPWRLTPVTPTLGYIQSSDNLTWVRVLHAGHMVPIAQPRVAMLVRRFVTAP